MGLYRAMTVVYLQGIFSFCRRARLTVANDQTVLRWRRDVGSGQNSTAPILVMFTDPFCMLRVVVYIFCKKYLTLLLSYKQHNTGRNNNELLQMLSSRRKCYFLSIGKES